jgi:hypothetical protein
VFSKEDLKAVFTERKGLFEKVKSLAKAYVEDIHYTVMQSYIVKKKKNKEELQAENDYEHLRVVKILDRMGIPWKTQEMLK